MKAESVLVCHFLARGHLVGLTEEFYCAYDFALVFGGIPFHLIPLGIWKLKDDNCVTKTTSFRPNVNTQPPRCSRRCHALAEQSSYNFGTHRRLSPCQPIFDDYNLVTTRFWQMNKI